MSQITIRKLDPGQRDEAAELLTRSFHDAPNMVYMFPEHLRHKAAKAAIAASLKNALTYNSVYAIWVDDQLAGVAVWLPPGAYPMPLSNQFRLLPEVLQMLVAAPTSFLRSLQFANAVNRHHPREPHWYLEVISVDPRFQGQGLGTRLITPGLEQADRDRVACYLETDTQKNATWYHKLGFTSRQENVRLLPDASPFWLMWRPPAKELRDESLTVSNA